MGRIANSKAEVDLLCLADMDGENLGFIGSLTFAER